MFLPNRPSQGSPGALDDATLSKLSQFRDQRRREEDHTAEATGLPAAHAPAGKILTVAGSKLTVVSASGTGERLASASKHEALSARLKDLRAAVGALEGKATRQPPPEMLGASYVTANDITKASDHGARRNLQTCPDGSGVTVTSPEFPLLEGCLEESEDSRFANDHVEFSSDTGAIISGAVETSNSTTMVNTLCFEFLVSALRTCVRVVCPTSGHLGFAASLSPCGEVGGVLPRLRTCEDGGFVAFVYRHKYTAGAQLACPVCSGNPFHPRWAFATHLSEGPDEMDQIKLDVVRSVPNSFQSSSFGPVVDGAPFWQDAWLAVSGDIATADFALACHSVELPSTVHPSEATWICECEH